MMYMIYGLFSPYLAQHAHYIRYPFVYSFIHSFIYSFVHPSIHQSIQSVIHSFIHSFIRSFVRSFVPSFLRSLLPSFLPSFVRSFVHSTDSFIYFERLVLAKPAKALLARPSGKIKCPNTPDNLNLCCHFDF